jgi:hypothetical protein
VHEHVAHLVLQQAEARHVERVFRGLVLDEIAEVASSPSPTGDCSEIGCCAIFKTARTRSTGICISSATSSGVGSRP